MGETDTGVVVVEATFKPEAEVRLEPRYGDFYREGSPIASATAEESGTVRFDGLPEGCQLWAVGDRFDGKTQAIAVTAKSQTQARDRLTEEQTRERLSATMPASGSGNPVVTGARGTDDAKFGRLNAEQQAAIANSIRPDAHEPTQAPEGADARTVAEGAGPFPKQADVPDSPQMSATPMGQATVMPHKAPPRPGIPQSAARDIPQASATELGEATPIGDVTIVRGEAQTDRQGKEPIVVENDREEVAGARLPVVPQDATGRDIAAPGVAGSREAAEQRVEQIDEQLVDDTDLTGEERAELEAERERLVTVLRQDNRDSLAVDEQTTVKSQGPTIGELEALDIKELRKRAKAAGVSAGGSKADIAARLVPAQDAISTDTAPGTGENRGLVQERQDSVDAAAAQIEGREPLETPAPEDVVVPSDPIANTDGTLNKERAEGDPEAADSSQPPAEG